MIIDDSTLVTAMGAAIVAVSAFYAWQQRFLMSMIPEMKDAIERNTAVGEKIMIILEGRCKDDR